MRLIRHFRFITPTLLIAACSSGCGAKFQNPANSTRKEPITSAPSPIASQLPSNPNLTIPGTSVGLLQLGDTRERVHELFPKKAGDEEYTYDKNCCGCSFDFSEIHWLPPDFKNNGLFIYLRQGRVFQIMAETDLFPTRDTIVEDSTPKEVRRHYPNLRKAFV